MSLLLAAVLYPISLAGQQHSVTLSLGGLKGDNTEWGRGFGATYGYRLRETRLLAMELETVFWANPNRKITKIEGSASRDTASLYLTPGIALRIRPKAVISPFIAAGGGLAVYEQSSLLQNGTAYPGDRVRRTGAVSFGGGVDVRVKSWLGFRGEVRDFYTGRAEERIPGGREHHVVAGIGFQIRLP